MSSEASLERQVKILTGVIGSLEHQLRATRIELGEMKDELKAKEEQLSVAHDAIAYLKYVVNQAGVPTKGLLMVRPCPMAMTRQRAADVSTLIGMAVVHYEPTLMDLPEYIETVTGRLLSGENLQNIPKETGGDG